MTFLAKNAPISTFQCPDLSSYPPNPVLAAFMGMDVICSTVSGLYATTMTMIMRNNDGYDMEDCRDVWRSSSWATRIFPRSWLDTPPIGPLNDIYPPPLSFEEYYRETFLPSLDENENESDYVGNLLRASYRYAFETETTSLSVLTTPTACVVLLLLIFVVRQIKSVLLPMFRRWGLNAAIRTHGTGWEREPSNAVRIHKVGEYIFRLLYHSIIATVGYVLLVRKQPWWNPDDGGTQHVFHLYPLHASPPGLTWYYMIQAAYNADAIVSLLELSFVVVWPDFLKGAGGGGGGGGGGDDTKNEENGELVDEDDKKRKDPSMSASATSSSSSSVFWRYVPHVAWSKDVRGDFREMFVHHLITNALVIGSSHCRFTRIGSMVFWVHDVSDVPVDMSKLANFVKWKSATALCFGWMVLFWLHFRLVLLPFVIYPSVWRDSFLVLETGHVPPPYYLLYQPVFLVLVGLIIVLHVLWFTMFIRMGYILIFRGEAHDLSEHKKGEEQVSAVSSSSSSMTTTTMANGGTNGGDATMMKKTK